jgi:hypothetical protein
VYLLKDGVAVYAHSFPPIDFSLKMITQTRVSNCLVTVYQQGGVQVCIDSDIGVFNAPLPPAFSECKVFSLGDFILLEGNNQLAVFDKNAELLLLEKFLSYRIDGALLSATLPLSDRLGRTAECAWRANEDRLIQTQFSLKQERGESRDIRAELLPYAFFESVLIGADYTPFLSEELLEKAQSLKEFLGDFQSVTLTDRADVCALVYPKGERIFQLRYFTVNLKNGKICDIVG